MCLHLESRTVILLRRAPTEGSFNLHFGGFFVGWTAIQFQNRRGRRRNDQITQSLIWDQSLLCSCFKMQCRTSDVTRIFKTKIVHPKACFEKSLPRFPLLTQTWHIRTSCRIQHKTQVSRKGKKSTKHLVIMKYLIFTGNLGQFFQQLKVFIGP